MCKHLKLGIKYCSLFGLDHKVFIMKSILKHGLYKFYLENHLQGNLKIIKFKFHFAQLTAPMNFITACGVFYTHTINDQVYMEKQISYSKLELVNNEEVVTRSFSIHDIAAVHHHMTRRGQVNNLLVTVNRFVLTHNIPPLRLSYMYM